MTNTPDETVKRRGAAAGTLALIIRVSIVVTGLLMIVFALMNDVRIRPRPGVERPDQAA